MVHKLKDKMYSLNSIVKIINKNNPKKYDFIGEITGYAEDLSNGGFYYAIEFDDDNNIYFFLEHEIELLGQYGYRRIRHKSYVHLGNLIFRVSDSYNTEKYIPEGFTHGNIFVLRFPEEYATEHVTSYIREIIKSSIEFKKSECLIIDYTKFKEMEYLGMGEEINDLLDSFKKNKGKEYVFAIKNKNLEYIIGRLVRNEHLKSFETLEDAIKYFKQ